LCSYRSSRPHLLANVAFLLVKPLHPSVYGRVIPDHGPALHVDNPFTGDPVPVFVMTDEHLLAKYELEYPRDHDTFVGFCSDALRRSVDSHDGLAEALGVQPLLSKRVIESDAWRSELITVDILTSKMAKFHS
jgi:hypothetical protein